MSASGSEPPVRGAVFLPSMDHLSDVKLHPPSRRASWVDRPRLMKAMAQAVRHPVTLVAAPAGYGKTTVVAQALAYMRAELDGKSEPTVDDAARSSAQARPDAGTLDLSDARRRPARELRRPHQRIRLPS